MHEDRNHSQLDEPSADTKPEDVLAIQASLRDMERGETGQDFEEFLREFRRRNQRDSKYGRSRSED
jgi:hypothetical protein